jgi:hypothetical protein
MTPEIKAPVEPAMFENPHVQPQAASAPKAKSASHKTAAPQVIENPHVTSAIRSASVTVEVR